PEDRPTLITPTGMPGRVRMPSNRRDSTHMTDIWDYEPKATAGEGEDRDFGPRIELTTAAIVNGKAVNGVPNPKYLGKTLLLEGVTVGEFETTNNDGAKITKKAIDAEKVTVVETGEVFDRQRLFPAGIVTKVSKMVEAAGGSVAVFPATVGEYESKKFPGRTFVELVRPTEDKRLEALKLADAQFPAQPEEAPF